MTGRRRRRTKKAVAAASADSMLLAPAVVMMRMPLLMQEAAGANPWRVETMRAYNEKAAAAVEGLVAAQLSLVHSASRFWFEAMSFQVPSIVSGAALHKAADAAMQPSRRTVRANYGRLGRS